MKNSIFKLNLVFVVIFSFAFGFIQGVDAQVESTIQISGELKHCQSESMFSSGSDYIDCGNCKKVNNRRGIGNTRGCE